MAEVPKPLDTALDFFLYAPVGLAVTAAEELPKLAAKGRSRVNTQLMMARVVGQFAVAKGRQEWERRFAAGPSGVAGSSSVGGAGPSGVAGAGPSGGAGAGSAVAGTGSAVAGLGSPAPVAPVPVPDLPPVPVPDLPPVNGQHRAPSTSGPDAGALAIPGYDSLSASQVVQRLAGLSQEERAAVGAYELAHRGRRTILNRIDQLQNQ